MASDASKYHLIFSSSYDLVRERRCIEKVLEALQALKNVGGIGEWRESYTLYDIPEKSGSLLEVIVMTHKTILPDDTIGKVFPNLVFIK